MFNYNSRRSTVHSVKGIAASTQPLASAAAIKILEQGGNAADAAVAMAAAMGVTEPMMTGIGGDVFCLYYDKQSNSVSGFNGSGKSPQSASLAEARTHANGGDHLPLSSGYAVTVPGAPAGWCNILELYGTMELEGVLQPAINLANDGFPVSEICQKMWANAESRLKNTGNGGDQLLIDGKAPVVGQIWTNPALAAVYSELAKQGQAGFYEGKIAEEIVAAVQRSGGKLAMDDLKNHQSLKVSPITMPVSDEVTLHELPPNNHGIVALIATGIVNQLHKVGKINLDELEHNSAEYIHVVAEALKFAFKDADHYVGDPDDSKDIAKLLSPEFIASRAALFKAERANDNYTHGAIGFENKSDTAYFTVADKHGNACSIIASLYHGFGSCIVPKGLGFALHNRGCNFNMREGTQNSYASGKRPYHTIIPAMLTRSDRLYASYGVMGGFMQPQGHLQVALNLCRFGMTPQVAIDAPRICIAPYPDDGEIPASDKVIIYLEEGIDPTVAFQLEALGHKTKMISGVARAQFGRGQIIRYEPQGDRLVYHAGSDPRGDGCAIPEL